VVHGDGIRVPTKQLRWVRYGTGGILGAADLQIITMNCDLLQSESLCGIFCCLEVYESIVAVTTNPNTDYWMILEDSHIFAHFFQCTVE
jgi:hypothetical protein